MEEQIIKSLIELYREQGIDVTAVVGDPIFSSLSVATRIDLIKKYADEISGESAPDITKHDIKRILRESTGGAAFGLAGGAIGAMRAGHYFIDPIKGTIAKPILAATAIGGALGLAGSALRTMSAVKSRQDLHRQALELAKDPSDRNAIKLMALRNMQPATVKRTDLLDKVYRMVEEKQFNEASIVMPKAGHQVFEANKGNEIYASDADRATRDRNTFADAASRSRPLFKV